MGKYKARFSTRAGLAVVHKRGNVVGRVVNSKIRERAHAAPLTSGIFSTFCLGVLASAPPCPTPPARSFPGFPIMSEFTQLNSEVRNVFIQVE
jgi:hypothetical protein